MDDTVEWSHCVVIREPSRLIAVNNLSKNFCITLASLIQSWQGHKFCWINQSLCPTYKEIQQYLFCPSSFVNKSPTRTQCLSILKSKLYSTRSKWYDVLSAWWKKVGTLSISKLTNVPNESGASLPRSRFYLTDLSGVKFFHVLDGGVMFLWELWFPQLPVFQDWLPQYEWNNLDCGIK